jgi:hypothetical protein
MKMPIKAITTALAALSPLLVALPAAAGAGSAHEHGVTHLEVAMDGSTLAIGLSGAGHHLVGFEHAPETDAQKAAWEDTRARLADATALFALDPAAGCRLASASVTPPAFEEEGSHDHHGDHDHDHKHGHGHGDHKHGHGHAHDKAATATQDHAHAGHHHHDDHGHHGHDHAERSSHDHDHDHAHGHAHDWAASYRFECRDPGRLTSIEVGLFTAFPAHEEVRFQRISAAGQSGGTLVPGRIRLALR